MNVYCAILGFKIDREEVCHGSRNHPRCQNFLNRDEKNEYPRQERKPLSGETLQAVKKLVIAECANWQRTGPLGVSNYCWMKEKTNSGVCVYFNRDAPQCSYFELAVLPLDAELKEDYFSRKESNGRETENRPAIHRKGVGGGPGGVKVITPQPAKPRVSVGESIRQGLLSRAAFHGVDSEKQVKGH